MARSFLTGSLSRATTHLTEVNHGGGKKEEKLKWWGVIFYYLPRLREPNVSKQLGRNKLKEVMIMRIKNLSVFFLVFAVTIALLSGQPAMAA